MIVHKTNNQLQTINSHDLLSGGQNKILSVLQPLSFSIWQAFYT